ncbi:MAG: cytochrome c3 family protein [Nitrospirae bacterium]|nr:cytochrome c3 family protein [Nitrospirota bacterium]MCL5423421.1 cytochrome c3 family protein [Nitrospirota bacterium]
MPATSDPMNQYGLRKPAADPSNPPPDEVQSEAMNERLQNFNSVATCSVCHDQHSQFAKPWDPAAPSYGGPGTGAGRHFQRIDNNMDQMCKDCHAYRDVASPTVTQMSHPVGVSIPGSGAYQTPPNLDLDSSGNVQCQTCHTPHYTDSGGANSGAGDGYLLDDTLKDVCYECHTFSQTVHLSPTTGLLWPGGQYGSTYARVDGSGNLIPLENTSLGNNLQPVPAAFQGACINCHWPHGVRDDSPAGQFYPNLTVEQSVEQKDANNMAVLDTSQNPSPPLPSSDSNDLCLTCHDTQVYSTTEGRNLDAINWTAVQHGAVAASGTNRGDLEDPYLTYSAGYSRNLVLACTDCHTPHGSGNIFLIRESINGRSVTVTTAGYWYSICDACHTINSGMGHPANPGSSCSGGMGGCHGTRLHTSSQF